VVVLSIGNSISLLSQQHKKGQVMHRSGVLGFKEALLNFCERLNLNEIFSQELVDYGLFSYVLTKKQKNKIEKICKTYHWPINNSKGVTVYVKDLKHVLNARMKKDKFTWSECAELIFLAYSPRSEVAINDHKNKNYQTFVLNAQERFMVKNVAKYGGVILDVSKNNLAQVTSYDASQAKVKAILGR